ncbi:MAG TPA: VWA domain-containing protein [Gemmatimonadales bacterium]|nr:VWA domain-containing protein [Gemmatimonadales bacterium]
MSLAHPEALLLLALLVPVGWLVLRGERRRAAALRAFGEPAVLGQSSVLADPARRARRRALRFLALGLGVVALARPQSGERPATLVRSGRDVLVALDLSRSMRVGDVGTTRLAAAKRVARDLLGRGTGDRLGLVVFGGSAFLQLPLTTDRSAFERFLEAASPDDLGDPATDLSAALAAAAEAFEHEGVRGHRAVLILSDGEGVEGELGPPLAALAEAGIPVFAVGVGSAAGGPVPGDSAEAGEAYHRDHIGRVVVSRLVEAELRTVAERTRGVYARWDDRAALERLGAQLARLPGRPLSGREVPQRADRFQWPLGLGLLSWLAASLVSVAASRRAGRGGRAAPARAMAVASLVALSVPGCGSLGREMRRAERLYEEGRYREAQELYRRLAGSRDDPALRYDLGNALYRMRRYEAAAREFERARRGAVVDSLRQRAAFNLGNAYVRAAEEADRKLELLERAVRAYEAALRLDPGDRDAKWNLELALRRLDEQGQRGSRGRPGLADYGGGDNRERGYQGDDAQVGAMAGGGFGSAEGESAEELSESAARALLEAVQREQLATHDGRRLRRGPVGERDW